MIRPLVFLYAAFAGFFAIGCAGAAEPVKDDFRGLRTGMTRDEARQAVSAHGGQCSDTGGATVPDQMACRYGNEANAFLYMTGKGHVTRLRIIFNGDFDELDIQRYLIEAYKLAPDPLSQGLYKNSSPSRFTFSRMGSGQYAFEIINREVALKDNPESRARLPRL